MNAAFKPETVTIERADLSASIFEATGTQALAIRAGTIIRFGERTHAFENSIPLVLPGLVAGMDYKVWIDADGQPFALPCADFNPLDEATIGGFHFAPAGNAAARAGGAAGPAINPFSCWDLGFRPACPDPRGMTLVDDWFWADIYLLGTRHADRGTSRHGETIADGKDLPQHPGGSGFVKKLDYATATTIYAAHGKTLLGAEEFFAAAYGVTERQSRDDEPTVTGLLDDNAIRFVSRWGLFDATGTMWQWGTDGDPDTPRASILGGSWIYGGSAGSRCAILGNWPVFSFGFLGARGRSDHLNPVA